MRRAPLHLVAAAALLTAGVVPPAMAQAPQPPRKPVVANKTAPQAPQDGLETTPLDFELLGMRFRPPAGSVMRADGQGANAVWIVSERAETPRYILRVTRLVASEPTSSPARQIDSLIKSVSERPSPDTVFAVLDREEFTLGDRPAASLYTSLREGSGEDEVSAVQGYFMVQIAPNEFVVISSLVAEQDFRGVRGLLDRSFRTIEIEDPTVVAAARDARVQRGAALLASLDEAALRKAMDAPGPGGAPPTPHWFRMTRTLGDGTVREEGYMTILAVEAEQGAANPDRSAKEWTAEEREKGLAVRVQMRILGDERGTTMVDTDARYWMRWDRGREFWTVRTTARSGKTSKTSSQLGIRTEPSAGMPKPTLQVATVNLDVPAEEPKRWNIPTAYLSQAEALLLPRLLPRPDAPVDLGFYWFDARSGRMTQRMDRVRPSGAGFLLETRATLEAPFLEQRCDAAGQVERRAADDGTVIEAIEPKALLELWQRKGLPTQ
jgi:hypothetical protein